MSPLPSIVQAVHDLDRALVDAGIAYAIGGALSLAFCVADPRATADIDLMALVDPADAERLRAALTEVVEIDEDQLRRLRQVGQVERLSAYPSGGLTTDGVRVDVFLPMAQLHHDAVDRAAVHEFAGRPVRFLQCRDLATFKVLFDRPKDWVDLAEMVRAGLDVDAVRQNLLDLFGESEAAEINRAVERLRGA